MSIERSGAAILIECLKRQGVEFVFGYPGGAVLPIYDELFADDGIRHILVRHEAGAAHAAEGYARSTGKPGVVLVTSGPGATNAVTGIADAYMDSIPMVVITGQVPTALIGTDAFQEADTIGLTRHCTKHNYLVKDPERLGATIEEAFRIATSGRPGPVVVDIPKDVQIALASWDGQDESPLPSHRYQPRMVGAADEIAEAVEMLAGAERPVFYTGGGVINAGPRATQLLRKLQDMTGAPVTSTLMGLGAFPADHPDWLGMLGMHGTYEANMTMNRADLIIAIGARFDDRVTGRLDAFAPEAKKVHIDIERASINNGAAAGSTTKSRPARPAVGPRFRGGRAAGPSPARIRWSRRGRPAAAPPVLRRWIPHQVVGPLHRPVAAPPASMLTRARRSHLTRRGHASTRFTRPAWHHTRCHWRSTTRSQRCPGTVPRS